MRPRAVGSLRQAARLERSKVLDGAAARQYGAIRADTPVLVILAAGKGTRFGQAPKCAQPVRGIPLARHSIDAFRGFSPSPVDLRRRLSPRGGDVGAGRRQCLRPLGQSGRRNGLRCLRGPQRARHWRSTNPVLVITMGDRIVAPGVFRKLCETHTARAARGRPDVADRRSTSRRRTRARDGSCAMRPARCRADRRAAGHRCARRTAPRGRRLDDLTEGNCPLYAIRAGTLRRYLETV